MSTGGSRLNELIRKRGFTIGAVAEAIGVNPNTITRWTGNAPIEKLWSIHLLTGIPFLEIAEVFKPENGTNEDLSQDTGKKDLPVTPQEIERVFSGLHEEIAHVRSEMAAINNRLDRMEIESYIPARESN